MLSSLFRVLLISSYSMVNPLAVWVGHTLGHTYTYSEYHEAKTTDYFTTGE